MFLLRGDAQYLIRALWLEVQKQPFACNIHKKTPVLESIFNKIADFQACNFIKKWLQHRCFPVNIAKFL